MGIMKLRLLLLLAPSSVDHSHHRFAVCLDSSPFIFGFSILLALLMLLLMKNMEKHHRMSGLKALLGLLVGLLYSNPVVLFERNLYPFFSSLGYFFVVFFTYQAMLYLQSW